MVSRHDTFNKTKPQLTRRRQLDKERALSTASNPSSSKFGSALLSSTLAQDGRALNNEVSKLERQLKRTQIHMEHAQKRFLQKQQQLPEPTLIVVRPPSPLLMKKFLYWNRTSDAPYTHSPDEPSYMRSLRSKARAPLAHPTIDAFSVKVRKKKNIWEEALHTDADAHFCSVVQPCWPLTPLEEAELRAGWQLHARPTTATGRTTPVTVQHRVSSAKRQPGILKNSSCKATFITEVLAASEKDKEAKSSVRRYVLKNPTTLHKKEVQWRT